MKYPWLFFLLCPAALFAQTPFPALPPVFRDDVVPRVDLLLPPDSLELLLIPGSEYHWHATFVFDNGDIKDTLENVGVKIRGNTSVGAQKKSLRVSFNTYELGRTWHGLEKLNLNGSHNDPIVARAKISWDLLRSMEIPGPRSNLVELYINGNFFGLYVNVEHVDEVFVQQRFGNSEGNLYKCLWPADLDYKGSNSDLYKEEFGGRRAYDLVTNETADDYTDLANFIGILNNTPIADLPCELEAVFNVDAYLKVIAFDILDGNWDNAIYNKNNFYLYHNVATDRFEYIPYDLDNTLGIDWLNVDWVTRNIYSWAPSSEERPLYKRLMQVPEYKDRFSFYMSQYLAQVFHPDTLFPYLDDLKALISPSAEADPYRPLDYGFTMNDFEDGWDDTLPWFHTPNGVKSYISGRRMKALQQLILGDISPIIHGVSHSFSLDTAALRIHASATDDHLLSSMKVCYRWNGQAQTCLDLFDDGLHADGNAGDGLYGVAVEMAGNSGLFEYFVQASDDEGQQSRYPLCGWHLVYVGEEIAPLAINEIMANNTDTYPDEAGEFEDWLEIFNRRDAPVSLQNYYLSDDETLPGKWKMPNIWMQAQQYLVFWADSDESQGSRHTNFKLSAGGEFLAIYQKNAGGFTLVDSYSFGEQTAGNPLGRLPDGFGDFQAVEPTPGAKNQPPTASDDTEMANLSVVLSPNPTASRLDISLENEMETLAEVELRDAKGILFFHKDLINSAFFEISMEAAPPGVYFLKVKTSGGRVVWNKVVRV